MSTSRPKSSHTTYPMVGKRASDPDPKPKYGRMFLHVGAAAVMAKGFMALQGVAAAKVMQPQYGGFFQYLTIIGLLTSGIAMLVAAVSDLLPNVKVLKGIKRGFLLFSLPIEIVISTIYWSIVLTKPDLMFPAQTNTNATNAEPSAEPADLLFRIPLWMDLSMHLLPAVALLLDFFILEKKFGPRASTRGAPALACSFGLVYALWIEHAATINGKFPYPFLTIMSRAQRNIFYMFAVMGALLTFKLLNSLHR